MYAGMAVPPDTYVYEEVDKKTAAEAAELARKVRGFVDGACPDL